MRNTLTFLHKLTNKNYHILFVILSMAGIEKLQTDRSIELLRTWKSTTAKSYMACTFFILNISFILLGGLGKRSLEMADLECKFHKNWTKSWDPNNFYWAIGLFLVGWRTFILPSLIILLWNVYFSEFSGRWLNPSRVLHTKTSFVFLPSSAEFIKLRFQIISNHSWKLSQKDLNC